MKKNMLNLGSIIFILKEVFKFLSYRRKIQFFLLIFLGLISSFLELITLTTIIPFISILLGKSIEMKFGIIDYVLVYFDNQNELKTVCLIFGIFVFISSLFRISIIRFAILLANMISADLSIKIFSLRLFSNYIFQVKRGTNEIVSVISQKINEITSIFTSCCLIITSSILVIVIFLYLLIQEPIITIFAFLLIGISYLIISLLIQSRVLKNSKIVSKNQLSFLRILRESLGGIREVIINNLQNLYVLNYSKQVLRTQKTVALNQFFQQSPKILVETCFILSVITIIYFVQKNTGKFETFIPTFAFFIYAAMRTIPLINLIYQNYSGVIARSSQLKETYDLLNIQNEIINKERNDKINFQNFFELKNVYFSYENNDSKMLLENINLKIKKGSLVSLVGKNGSGKSTLMDIMMGLLEPSKGEIIVDSIKLNQSKIKSWQLNISHLPQNFFLANLSVKENIALGQNISNKTIEKIIKVSKLANIYEFIESLPNKFDAVIGEKGSNLSGGQKQRICLARALFKSTNVLFLDEPTSALDLSSQSNFLELIQKLKSNDITLIIVTHSDLIKSQSDEIYEIKDKRLIKLK